MTQDATTRPWAPLMSGWISKYGTADQVQGLSEQLTDRAFEQALTAMKSALLDFEAEKTQLEENAVVMAKAWLGEDRSRDRWAAMAFRAALIFPELLALHGWTTPPTLSELVAADTGIPPGVRGGAVPTEVAEGPVPADVDWSSEHDNFYQHNGPGMGNEFYAKWWTRRAEFMTREKRENFPVPPAMEEPATATKDVAPPLLPDFQEGRLFWIGGPELAQLVNFAHLAIAHQDAELLKAGWAALDVLSATAKEQHLPNILVSAAENSTGEVLQDVVTHSMHWRRGLEVLKVASNDDADDSFWERELAVVDRLIGQAKEGLKGGTTVEAVSEAWRQGDLHGQRLALDQLQAHLTARAEALDR